MSKLVPATHNEAISKVHPEPDSQNRTGRSSTQRKKWNMWSIIAHKNGVQATKERLKSYWTTLGVVSALMMALTYPAVTSPSVTKRDGGSDHSDGLFIAYVLLNAASLLMSMVVLIQSVVLLAEVDLVVTDEDLEVFIERYQIIFIWLTGVFSMSLFALVAGITVLAFFNFTKGTAIGVIAICVSCTLSVAAPSLWLAVWTRSRLKFHIDTANALLKNVVAKLRVKSGAPSTTSNGSLGAAGAAFVEAGAGRDGGACGEGDDSQRNPRSQSTL